MIAKLKDIVIELHDCARAESDPAFARALRQVADDMSALVKMIKQQERLNESNR